jgi:hypothetical protein
VEPTLVGPLGAAVASGQAVEVVFALDREQILNPPLWYALHDAASGELELALFREIGGALMWTTEGTRRVQPKWPDLELEADWLAPISLELTDPICPPWDGSCFDVGVPRQRGALVAAADGEELWVPSGSDTELAGYFLHVAFAGQGQVCDVGVDPGILGAVLQQ